ncbi:arylsulfatase [Novosphingobium profundi]|uniref:arylsulfatase n=1 Tax=Novosphingobium profundi TaxID=1774954 RepID=UPI001BD9CA06|nr:arylsulfatase [Novosphingobium profundi]MBT0669158.1 arylsulfatase [Novosphingobium profundi]
MKFPAILMSGAAFLALAQTALAAPADGPALPASSPLDRGAPGPTDAQSYPPAAGSRPTAPKGAPNVLLIMTDDTGFGSASTFGGPVPTPTIDALAGQGITYNRFHTTALCAPTRAALLTGRNQHSVGFGALPEIATNYPGYDAELPKSAATIGEVLRQNGYSTAWFGKNHNTPRQEITQVGPFDRWPTGLGFEEFYGFMGGETSPFTPSLYRGTTPVDPSLNDPHYLLDRDLADHAVRWMHIQHMIAPEKPFLLYYAPGTTHAPLAAPRDWIAKFRGKFDQGWDKMRKETFRRQKALGIIPASAELTQRPSEIPSWDSMSADQKQVAARMMEVYAAALAYCDNQIGRLIESLRKSGQLQNTIVIFIEGDNGASGDGGILGSTNEVLTQNGVIQDTATMHGDLDAIGGPMTLTQIPAPWAWAMDTPFQWTKQIASHFGGTRNGLVISWPERIRHDGKVRSQFASVIDIAPTLYDAIGITPPGEVNGVTQMPLAGHSLMSSFFDAGAPSPHSTQYFEVMGNRAIYQDGWIASTHPLRLPWTHRQAPRPESFSWELYDITKDYSQAHDLAAQMPGKLAEMKAAFDAEARKFNVYPIDSRGFERLNDAKTHPAPPRLHYSLAASPDWYEQGAWPDIKNRSWSLRAAVTLSSDHAQGMIGGQGGQFGGWGVYLLKGKPVFYYRRTQAPGDSLRIVGDRALSPGPHDIKLQFDYDGGGYGKGGTASLLVDGTMVAQGHVPSTVPAWISEPGTVGHDVGTALNQDYALPFAFEGHIRSLDIDLAPPIELSSAQTAALSKMTYQEGER